MFPDNIRRRHSRESGNPLGKPDWHSELARKGSSLAWIPAFAGMTVKEHTDKESPHCVTTVRRGGAVTRYALARTTSSLLFPSGPVDQFTAAVGADVRHLLRTLSAESTFVGADESLRMVWKPLLALLARGFHFQRHVSRSPDLARRYLPCNSNFAADRGGSSCSRVSNTPLVQPNPTMFWEYPTRTLVSSERVTTLYFSRIVPSRR